LFNYLADLSIFLILQPSGTEIPSLWIISHKSGDGLSSDCHKRFVLAFPGAF